MKPPLPHTLRSCLGNEENSTDPMLVAAAVPFAGVLGVRAGVKALGVEEQGF